MGWAGELFDGPGVQGAMTPGSGGIADSPMGCGMCLGSCGIGLVDYYIWNMGLESCGIGLQPGQL